jgi:hypothetical protein
MVNLFLHTKTQIFRLLQEHGLVLGKSLRLYKVNQHFVANLLEVLIIVLVFLISGVSSIGLTRKVSFFN